MEPNKTFLITTFGLSAYEARVLQTICIISRNRTRTYEVGSALGSRPVDFAIVDHEDPQAVAAWERFQASNPMVPAVMLTKQPAADPSRFQIRRPIMATRLLTLLDSLKVPTERPAFAPPGGSVTAEPSSSVRQPACRNPLAPRNASLLSALVVDDSLPIRRQIQHQLAPFVGVVDLAENGEQALDLVARRSYDIVFLDVVLPGMDGYKLCRAIKRDKRTKGTPVIMLTGKSSPFDRVKGKLAGCDTYLTKPVDHNTFEDVVQRYLNPGEGAFADANDAFGRSIPGRA